MVLPKLVQLSGIEEKRRKDNMRFNGLCCNVETV